MPRTSKYQEIVNPINYERVALAYSKANWMWENYCTNQERRCPSWQEVVKFIEDEMQGMAGKTMDYSLSGGIEIKMADGRFSIGLHPELMAFYNEPADQAVA